MAPPDPTLLIFAGVLFLAGIVERIAAGKHRRETEAKLARWMRGEGVVSRMIIRKHESRLTETTSESSSPVVRFRANDGVEYEFEPEQPVGEVGSKVQIAWDPELPSDVIALVPDPLVKRGCGLILIAVAVALAVKAWLG